MTIIEKPDFKIQLLKEASNLIQKLDEETRSHIYLKLKKAQYENNPRKFSKVRGVIWEFRIPFKKKAYRFYSFWCKNEDSLIVATHGIIKKQNKAPKKEVDKAERIMNQYYEGHKKKKFG